MPELSLSCGMDCHTDFARSHMNKHFIQTKAIINVIKKVQDHFHSLYKRNIATQDHFNIYHGKYIDEECLLSA